MVIKRCFVFKSKVLPYLHAFQQKDLLDQQRNLICWTQNGIGADKNVNADVEEIEREIKKWL